MTHPVRTHSMAIISTPAHPPASFTICENECIGEGWSDGRKSGVCIATTCRSLYCTLYTVCLDIIVHFISEDIQVDLFIWNYYLSSR